MNIGSTPKIWSSQNDFRKGVVLILIGAACFSTKAIFVKLTLAHGVDAITALMLRMLFALPYYLGIIVFSPSITLKNIKSAPWIKLLTIGLLGYYLASLFDFMGLQYVQANLERLIIFIYPTLVLLLGAWLFKRKISKPQAIAVAITYSGILIACVSQDFDFNSTNIGLGIFYIFLSALTYAFYLVFSDNLIRQIGIITFNSLSMLISIIAVLIHFGWIYGLNVFHYDWQVYVYGFLMGIIATVIPTYTLTKGISIIGSSNAAILSTFGPIATILMSYFILHEPFSLTQGIGTILVLVGVLFLGLRGKG
ncbi:MAG: DMT family transporter [Chitinophagales bacterium]|nr:DMT family transporter [Chitinophagales bacterium]